MRIFRNWYGVTYREEAGDPVGGGDPVDPAPDGDPVDPAPDGDPVDPAPDGDPVDPVGGGDPVDPAPDGDPVDPAPDGDPVDPEGFLSSTPDDWREQVAGDDSKYLKQLQRYASLEAYLKAGREAQDRIRKGEMSTGLPDDPTDEQLKEYREANGIPENAEGYEVNLDEGLVLSDEDQRIMKPVFEAALAENLSSSAISSLTNAMLQGRQAEAQALMAQDGLDSQTAERQMRDAWGGDYEANKNLVANVIIGQLPESVRDEFKNARLGNGQAMFNSPEMLSFFADAARKISPSATVVPNANNPVQSIDDEIAKLRGRMGTDEWYDDKQAQSRYQALLDAKSNMR